jgi:hypothetical protein
MTLAKQKILEMAAQYTTYVNLFNTNNYFNEEEIS